PPFRTTFDTTLVDDGCEDLRAVAVDSAGESAASTTLTGLVANFALAEPIACISDPGRSLTGTVSLDASGASSDGGTVTAIEFQESPAGQEDWATFGQDDAPPYAARLDTTKLPDGPIELRARIVDSNGSAAVSEVRSASVVNEAPVVSLADP